jgi:hypothetical protein
MDCNVSRGYKFRNTKKKMLMDWSQTKIRGWGKHQRPPYYGILREAGREEDQRMAGEDRLSKKRGEAGTN